MRTRTMRALSAALLAVVAWQAAGAVNGQGSPKAEAFVDVKGQIHHPLDARGGRAVVLFFLTTDCPIANYYTSEISAIVKDHASRPVRFYVVHVDSDLTPADARKHAKTYGLTCPILIDAKHRLVKATGATVTPEAAVLSADGKLAYRGRIDDCYTDLGKRRVAPDQRDLRDALAAVLAGRPVARPRTTALGCPIPDLP
jgi:thiol-disulfide isomerase/thioredoxin